MKKVLFTRLTFATTGFKGKSKQSKQKQCIPRIYIYNIRVLYILI